MCGIAGLANLKSLTASEALVHQMLELVAHRGPDGEGVFSDGPIVLGHRRLSIVDLSDAGAQPMRSSDGLLVITYNGEIYNHIEIRKELERKGCEFRSHCDTEVILHAYAVWGESCVSRFNGMWAFAIWDKQARRLFCSRDRFGVKPFYYVMHGELFAFGSEIRQLLLLQDKRRAVRLRVEEFILTGMTDHTNGSFFADIKKLPAGHNLVWSDRQPRAVIQRYYRLDASTNTHNTGTEQAVERYGALLQDAVRLRLRSDVPVGTCLSGGLDSSSIAALAAPIFMKHTGRRFTAITAVSEQVENNEEHFAQQVVEASHLDWHRVRPSYSDLRSQLDDVVKTQEEPFGSASIVMQYAVMKKARAEGIPVLLDGQGGDETLLGYPKYVAAYLAGQWRDKGFIGIARALRSAGQNNTSWSFAKVAAYLAGSRWAGMRYWYYCKVHGYLRQKPPLPDHLRRFASVCFDEFELQRLELESTNLPALLRYEDKNSMAHSIETRLPFLDYRLVELALSLPADLKIRDGWSKWLLRRTICSHLPPSIAWRRDKLGFEAPERSWQSRIEKDMRHTVLNSALLHEIADQGMLEQVFHRLPIRAKWRLYSVAMWAQTFDIQGFREAEPDGSMDETGLP